MDVDEPLEDVNIPRKEMIQSLTVVLEKQSRLENILDMITDWLMFDDPGLFDVRLLHDSRDKLLQEAVNLWLINQILNLLTKPGCARLAPNILNLQKEMLAASFIKQPWFFEKLFKLYIEFARILSPGFDVTPDTPISVGLFQSDSEVLNILSENCTFPSINITSNEVCLILEETNLKLLIQSVALLEESNKNLFKACTESVAHAYSQSPFDIKIYCLNYFGKIWKQTACLSADCLEAYMMNVFQSTEIVIGQMDLWFKEGAISTDDIKTYCNELSKLFELFEPTALQITENLTSKCFVITTKIRDLIQESVAENRLKVVISIYKFQWKLLEKCENIQFNHEIRSCVTANSVILEAIPLLQITIYKQLICSSNDSFESDYFVDSLIGEILQNLKNNQSSSEIKDKLLLIEKLINLVINIEHDVCLWHQNQHIKSLNCNICSSNKSFELKDIQIDTFNYKLKMKDIKISILKNHNEIIEEFLEIIQANTYITDQHIYTISNISSGLLNLSINKTVRDNLKKQLFHVSLLLVTNSDALSNINLKFVSKYAGIIDEIHSTNQWQDILTKTLQHLNPLAISKDQTNILLKLLKTISTKLPENQIHSIAAFGVNLSILNVDLNGIFDNEFWTEQFQRKSQDIIASDLIKNLTCIHSGKAYIIYVHKKELSEYRVCCELCNYSDIDMKSCPGIIQMIDFNRKNFIEQNLTKWIKLFQSNDNQVRLSMVESLPMLASHFAGHLCKVDNIKCWSKIFLDHDLDILNVLSDIIGLVFERIDKSSVDVTLKENMMKEWNQNISTALKQSIDNKNVFQQKCLLDLIKSFGTSSAATEGILLNCIRATSLFMLCVNSYVAREAALYTKDICLHHKVTPRMLLNWHSKDMMQHIVTLAVITFLRCGYGLEKSFYILGPTFDFVSVPEFIYHNLTAIISNILPFCLKIDKTQQLLEEIATLLSCTISDLLSKSFLSIYIYLFRNETSETFDAGIEYIVNITKKSLKDHLKEDIRKTLPEILSCFHQSPEFVMKTCRIFIASTENPQDLPIAKIADYMSARFLGVLTYFGQIVIFTDIEKSIQLETLQSLGDIIRFMGSTCITQFRFKILAVLKSALVLVTNNRPDLCNVCLEVWKIFIHTIDVQALGSLLSVIFVSLEPLCKTHAQEIDEILKYMIISNGNLLSNHISDLFFIEDTAASDEIKQFVVQHSDSQKDANNFISKFRLYFKNANHHNIDVRIYALRYMTRLFQGDRIGLNELIVGQQEMHPMIEDLLNVLMFGCKHNDENLQLESAKCLGQVGAVEPTLMPPNYARQISLAFNIHTDEFAIIALAELCRAFQSQKDTKYIDGFSLAIQEILVSNKVNPKEGRKINVWQAIPEKVRPLMEPLLTSCYTNIENNIKKFPHPIFGKIKCISSEYWAFSWSTSMIGSIKNETNTQHLLKSFKSAMKNDSYILSTFLPYILIHVLQNNNDEHNKVGEELQTVFSEVLNQFENPDSMTNCSGTDVTMKCAKIGFNLLDFLERWLRQFRSSYESSKEYKRIQSFIGTFDKKMLARVNFVCGEYARSLIYLESYIEKKPKERLQSELSFLSQIYAELMDTDALEGALSMKQQNLTLSEQVLLNAAVGRIQDSTVCFEKMMQSGDVSENNAINMIQYYLSLDQPKTALIVSQSLMKQMHDKYNDYLLEGCAESLWRLGQFDELDSFLKGNQLNDNQTWGIRCGQAILSFQQENEKDFLSEIVNCRLSVLKQLQVTGDELSAYHKGYPMVIKLHLILEIEQLRTAVDEFTKIDQISDATLYLSKFFTDWDYRLNILQPTAKTIEPVLCLRRILLTKTKELISKKCPNHDVINTANILINRYLGKSLIKSVEFARNAELSQQAQLFVLHAEQYKPKDLFLEKAKLLWDKSNPSASLKTLERGIESIMNGHKSLENLSRHDRRICGEAKYLVAMYNAESMNTNHELNVQNFKDALEVLPEAEKCFVSYAQYLDKVYAAMTSQEQERSIGSECQLQIMTLYGKSLMFGCRYIHQSMPRFLTVWLDFTAQSKNDSNQYNKIAQSMNKFSEECSKRLPPFMFFSTFSQLVSRICHPSREVYNVLKTIIIKLILNFPQQSLWMILSVYKSSDTSRVRRCTEIFSDKRLSSKNIQKLIQHFNILALQLIELTNKEFPGSQTKFSISVEFRRLINLFKDKDFSEILMPTEKFMQAVLPALVDRDDPATSFNAFPNTMVYIQSIRDELIVLTSLQRPRRITLVGSDGKDYGLMLKPKDDLRKDFRLMEFNAIVRQYLHQDPEARHRRLHIRTYAVLPLNEECGILEWVENLQTFRQILNSYYKPRKLGLNRKQMEEAQRMMRETPDAKLKFFKEKLLPFHPPMFANWFLERFTTPHNWYQARSSYIRTTAVMSIVGYILGLGDRHGENILFDASNGDTVHVDFNCLFNKGEEFEVPELVPFRLTNNMVHAMGPCGIEGSMRKCSEITLKVMQKQIHPLMAVLRPFVYDPLVSWNRLIKVDPKLEKTDDLAIRNVNRIEERLKGFIRINKVMSNMPLSTDGVVNHCINESTDLKKLSAMYFGWMPFM